MNNICIITVILNMEEFRQCKSINGVKWYPKMKKGYGKNVLMNVYKIEDLYNHLVICNAIEKENYTERYFAYFDSYTDFYVYMLGIKQEERCYFEVIQGKYSQKPHFDVDISFKKIKKDYGDILGDMVDISFADKIKDCLITNIIKKLETLGVKININEDILLYTSHGEDKRSFHVIVNNYCHSDNIQARYFRDEVVELVKNSLFDDNVVVSFKKNSIDIVSVIIDMSVYSSLQQFRIVSCQKYGTNRIKYFNEIFNYNGDTIHHDYKQNFETDQEKQLKILSDSLISFCSDCEQLPVIKIYKPKPIINNNINDNYFNYAYTFVEKIYGKNAFSIRDIDCNNMTANLNILKPYYCYVCSKVHEHENPRIYINGNSAFWNCRRTKKRILLCRISVLDVEKLEKPQSSDQHNDKNNELFTFNMGSYNVKNIDKKTSFTFETGSYDIQNGRDILHDDKITSISDGPSMPNLWDNNNCSINNQELNVESKINNTDKKIPFKKLNSITYNTEYKLPIVSSAKKRKECQPRDVVREMQNLKKKTITIDDVFNTVESHIKNKQTFV